MFMVSFHRKPSYKNSSRSTETDGLVERMCKCENQPVKFSALFHIILPPTVFKRKSLLFIERVFREQVLDYKMPQLAVYSSAEISFLPYFSSSFAFFIQPHLERPLIKSTPESFYKASS